MAIDLLGNLARKISTTLESWEKTRSIYQELTNKDVSTFGLNIFMGDVVHGSSPEEGNDLNALIMLKSLKEHFAGNPDYAVPFEVGSDYPEFMEILLNAFKLSQKNVTRKITAVEPSARKNELDRLFKKASGEFLEVIGLLLDADILKAFTSRVETEIKKSGASVAEVPKEKEQVQLGITLTERIMQLEFIKAGDSSFKGLEEDKADLEGYLSETINRYNALAQKHKQIAA
jgi:hypothetical protein